MAYFKVYDASGNEVTSGNPLDFGTLNRDDEEVSSWLKGVIVSDDGLVSTGNTTVSVVDATGGDSSGLFQLAPDNAGSADEGNAEAYGDDLTIAGAINDTTGVPFWARRKAGPAEEPVVDATAIVRVTGVVIPE
jgi:hypothetical protein